MIRTDRILEELQPSYPGIKYLTGIKSGKEAEVHLLEADKELFALKQYKHGLKFKSRKEYFMMSEIRESRQGRAIKNNSRFGKKLTVSIWAAREFNVLEELYSYGANVPLVYKLGDDYLLQEFIGIGRTPAPQLLKVKLTEDQAAESFYTICKNIELIWDLGYVHGDLSPYNILWRDGETVIIDFPQVVMNSNNEEAPNKLLRDIENIAGYFGRYQIDGYQAELNKLRGLAYSYWG